jgi:DNA invertase Pin-like site-specific DNA recombinase
MALVAEQEREAISQRTKAALAAAKARGVRLRNPKGTKVKNYAVSCARGVEAITANAQAFAERLRPVLVELDGLSANAAAQELDRRGHATARGGKWTAGAVINARARLGLSGSALKTWGGGAVRLRVCRSKTCVLGWREWHETHVLRRLRLD